jgi:hypothetical protein
MLGALLFSASLAAAVFFIWQIRIGLIWRICLGAAVASFGIVAYLFATSSTISPFGGNARTSFGYWDNTASIIVAVMGALLGVVGSVLFRSDSKPFNLNNCLRALATCPLILIPTLKLVETSGEQTLLSSILLFALSYQNGFFWERLLKGSAQ